MKLKHPAQYTPAVVDAMVKILDAHDVRGLVLDPFAGPGQSLVNFVAPRRRMLGIEIQPEWVEIGNDLLHGIPSSDVALHVGDATRTGLRARSVAAVCTSPTYGNRFSDHHNARDGSRRRSYTHDLQTMTGDITRHLVTDNAGQFAFGTTRYEDIHIAAWREMYRVTKPGGLFLLNVSDFIKNRQRVRVVNWHKKLCETVGWRYEGLRRIGTPRMRYGENHEARVPTEVILIFTKP